MRGTVLAVWRVLRCNPFSLGGYDPVERQTLFARREAAAQGVALVRPDGDPSRTCDHSGPSGCKEVGW